MATNHSVSGSDTVISYEDYINGKKDAAQRVRDQAYAQASEKRMQAEREARIYREQQVIDANTAYEQNRASYGANADALGRMGLTASGYADYLDSRAYATKRADISAASAYEANAVRQAKNIESDTRFAADQTYQQYIAGYDDKLMEYKLNEAQKAENGDAYRQQAYREFISWANDGTYTADQLVSMMGGYGFTEDEMKVVTDAANSYREKQQSDQKNAAEGEMYGLLGDYYMSAVSGTDVNYLKYQMTYKGISEDWQKLILQVAQNAKNQDHAANYDVLLSRVNQGESYDSLAPLMSLIGLPENLRNSLKSAADSYATTSGNEKNRQDFDTYYRQAMSGYGADALRSQMAGSGLTQAEQDIILAAADAYASGQTVDGYMLCLGYAKEGSMSAAELAGVMDTLGLTAEQKQAVNAAAAKRAGDDQAAKDQAAAEQNRQDFDTYYRQAMSGYGADALRSQMAGSGLTQAEQDIILAAANAYASGQTVDGYMLCLGYAKEGSMSAAELAGVMDTLGLTAEQKQAVNAAAAKRATDDQAGQNKDEFKDFYANAASGAYHSDYLKSAMAGSSLTDEQKNIVIAAAEKYQSGQSVEGYMLLLDSINDGADISTLKPLYSTLGIDESMQGLLESAARTYKKEGQVDGYYTCLDYARTGTYKPEELEKAMDYYGLDEEEKAYIKEEAASVQQEITDGEVRVEEEASAEEERASYVNKTTLKNDIYANPMDYTDAKIDEYGKYAGMTERDIAECREYARQMQVEEINGDIDLGDIDTAASKIEKLFGEGRMDEDTRHSLYFNIGLKAADNASVEDIDELETDLKRQKNAGRISETDYKSLTEYLYGRFGTVVTPEESGYNGKNYYAPIELGGSKFEATNIPDEKTVDMLNCISTGSSNSYPQLGTIVRYSGKTYTYRIKPVPLGDGRQIKEEQTWQEVVPRLSGNDAYFKDVDKKAAETEQERPVHYSRTGSWNSYDDAAQAGYGNIKTRSEWARSKEGCSTYEQYLDKMYQKYMNHSESGSKESVQTGLPGGSNAGSEKPSAGGPSNPGIGGGNTRPDHHVLSNK